MRAYFIVVLFFRKCGSSNLPDTNFVKKKTHYYFKRKFNHLLTCKTGTPSGRVGAVPEFSRKQQLNGKHEQHADTGHGSDLDEEIQHIAKLQQLQ